MPDDLLKCCDVESGGRLIVDGFTSGLKWCFRRRPIELAVLGFYQVDVQQKGAHLQTATLFRGGLEACLLWTQGSSPLGKCLLGSLRSAPLSLWDGCRRWRLPAVGYIRAETSYKSMVFKFPFREKLFTSSCDEHCSTTHGCSLRRRYSDTHRARLFS